jgi:hypothetical protein
MQNFVGESRAVWCSGTGVTVTPCDAVFNSVRSSAVPICTQCLSGVLGQPLNTLISTVQTGPSDREDFARSNSDRDQDAIERSLRPRDRHQQVDLLVFPGLRAASRSIARLWMFIWGYGKVAIRSTGPARRFRAPKLPPPVRDATFRQRESVNITPLHACGPARGRTRTERNGIRVPFANLRRPIGVRETNAPRRTRLRAVHGTALQ